MNQTPSAANSCHRCGTPAEEGDRYCMRCGVPLRTRDGEETVTAPSGRPENLWKRAGERPPFVLGEDRPERLTAGAIFVMMRGFRLWASEFPELEARLGRTVFRTKSVQSSYVTRGNLPEGVFDLVCERLRRL